MLVSSLSVALVCALPASVWEDSPALECRYTGALTKVSQSADANAVKRFSLYANVARQPDQGRRLAYFLSERGGGGWAWPERFGETALDLQLKSISGGSPRLLFEYEGNPIVIPLPLPVATYAGQLKAGARWTEGKESWEVVKRTPSQERDCWQVQVSNSFGRKRTLWIDASAPIVVSLEERVFVGQGDEHLLTMQLESLQPRDAEQLDRDNRALPALRRLQSGLERGDAAVQPELSDAQLKLVEQALPELLTQAEDTPWSGLVSAISRDFKAQSQRTDELARQAEKMIGKAAPAFALNLTDKTQVDEASFRDKITVLHFWEYQNEPLVEPYGQVGYLDFLSGRRKKLGVQVYGVAVDGRLGDEKSAAPAVKSIQRLKQFMNLGYGIAVDDGKLLSKFGDPRKFGAKLPLWVVIGPDGKIAHYHAGFYKIDPNEGLQQLDDLLVKLIRQQKGKE